MKPVWALALRLGASAFISGASAAQGATPAAQYGPLPNEVAEVCQPRIDLGPRPGILLIHGGGWTGGDKAILSARCRSLAASGYTVVNINYRLADGAPGNAWPAALDDARLALAWMRTNAAGLGVDTARIGVIGDSAGAQMAVFLGATGHRAGIQCVVEESGPVDLLTAQSFTARVSPWVFMAQPIGATYRSASPIFAIGRDSAPTMIVHGRADDLVPFSQAEELSAALHRQGIAAILVAYEGGHVLQGTTDAERNRVVSAETSYLRTCLHPDDGVGNLQ